MTIGKERVKRMSAKTEVGPDSFSSAFRTSWPQPSEDRQHFGALAIVLVWATMGPAANFSNTWQLVIDTGTTIVTFLMVFLLANASNRITEAQERMLSNIYSEERQLEADERLVKKLLDKIDVEHIRPILEHLDKQDHQVESVAERILAAVRKS
jgi:low affinity Fe/Cu permease